MTDFKYVCHTCKRKWEHAKKVEFQKHVMDHVGVPKLGISF